MRTCHFCHGPIDDVARVCPHCNAELIHRPPRRDVNGPLPGFVQAWRERLDEDHQARVMFQSAVLFVILVVIYVVYLLALVAPPRGATLSDVVWALAVFCLSSGAPVAVLACADHKWERKNVAPVALAAWITVFWFISRQRSNACPAAFALLFVPLLVTALVAHKIGALHHRERSA